MSEFSLINQDVSKQVGIILKVDNEADVKFIQVRIYLSSVRAPKNYSATVFMMIDEQLLSNYVCECVDMKFLLSKYCYCRDILLWLVSANIVTVVCSSKC